MGVFEALCAYPSITKADINGRRKPQSFVNGSANVSHDVYAVEIVNGLGTSDTTLGVAPRSTSTFGLYCSNAGPLLNLAKAGDVAFSLRAPGSSCAIANSSIPSIPLLTNRNDNKFIGNTRDPHKIFISNGAADANYGRKIDYFSPGDSASELGGGNISFALPQFAGMIIALNTALTKANRAILDINTIKQILDASSNEVFLESGGVRGVYKESAVRSGDKYFGQIVNLKKAIDNALAGSSSLTFVSLLVNVRNDNGGNASSDDFDIRINGGAYNGSVSRYAGQFVQIANNTTYNLSVNPPSGYQYKAQELSCKYDIGGANAGTSAPSTLRVSSSRSATCTLVVDDIAPKITLNLTVSNEDEGMRGPFDFTMRLSGSGISGIARSIGEQVTVKSNTSYLLKTDPVSGYSVKGVVCRDDQSNARLSAVRLNEGQNATCTINLIDREDSSFFIIPIKGGKSVVFGL